MFSTDVPDVVGHYDYRVVALSALLAMLGSYCTIELAGRVTAARGGMRISWLIGGAIAMGIATWSMHYTGMRAFRLPTPVQYDWPTSLLAYLPSLFASALGLFVVSQREMGFGRAFVSSIFMGGGIAALHYTAMESMRLQGMCHYSPGLVTLSVILAIVGSLMSLWLMFHFRDEPIGQDWRKIPSALLLGTAIVIMHYTGMASVSFASTSELPDLSHAVNISTLGIAGIAVVNAMVVVVVMATSVADRIQKQTALLDELFEQAPHAVVLTDADYRVVRVNKEFVRVFGYDLQEAIGRRIGELIGSDESREQEQKYADLVEQGQRVDAEGVGRRKDRSQLHVAMVRVPVALPHGKIAVYAIYRDITESKQAREALQEANAQLQTLSSRLLEAQESERRHLARELHDEIGQTLTAAKLNLESVRAHIEEGVIRSRLEESIAIVDGLLQQVRQISLDLRPPMLDDLGPVHALRWYLRQQSERAGFSSEFIDNTAGAKPSQQIATTCFRIAQEAVTNIIRHAGAQNVTIELRQEDGEELHLTVRDDGAGFDVTASQRRAREGASLGLLGMRERALLVGGRFEIRSAAGQGAEVHAWLPLPKSAQGFPEVSDARGDCGGLFAGPAQQEEPEYHK